jgi:hypothetical protein
MVSSLFIPFNKQSGLSKAKGPRPPYAKLDFYYCAAAGCQNFLGKTAQ